MIITWHMAMVLLFKEYGGTGESLAERNVVNYGVMRPEHDNARFVPAGQSTQMIIGATPENDYQLVTVAEALYKNYGLKRVFYSAFVNVNNDSALPSTEAGPPLFTGAQAVSGRLAVTFLWI